MEPEKAEAWVAKGVKADKTYDEVIKNGNVIEPLDANVENIKLDNALIRGRRDAKVMVVVFGGFECPYTARASGPLKALQAKYGADLAIVFKHFPLDFHVKSKPASLASMCADEQGKFWEFHDLVFDNQDTLEPADLKAHAKSLGLNLGKYDACVQSKKYANKVERDMGEARATGVRDTPTIFFNGRKYTSPLGYSVEAFSSVIDRYVLMK